MDTTRLAKATDAPLITELQLANWHISHPEIAEFLDSRDVQVQWESAIRDQSSRGRVLVCERDLVVVGVAAIEFEDQLGQLSLLEVTPTCRRQLIGSRLLNAVADIAGRAGASSMYSWVATADTSAQEFLESTGFTHTGATRTIGFHDGSTDLLTDQMYMSTNLENRA
jgi:N-acetylglutamate synthase-like GNAT family acetyltransferase